MNACVWSECRNTRRRFIKYFGAGDLAHCRFLSRAIYSGGTAPDSHRIPHLFPARTTGFPEAPPVGEGGMACLTYPPDPVNWNFFLRLAPCFVLP